MATSIPTVKVFLSSTTLDLAQYREVAGDVIAELNQRYEGRFNLVRSDMSKELPTGAPLTPVQISTDWVQRADWMVLTIGFWYGQVPDDADCSITDTEFRTAKANGLQLFVFKAGGKDQKPNAYRALPEEVERIDLKDYQVPTQDKDRFERFLAAVQGYTTPVLFKNLDHFKELLEQSLRQRIELELDKARGTNAGPVIAARVIDSQQALRDSVLLAIESAKQLALLKEIHDGLHRIRQFGIRRWRESVLNLWPEDGGPTPMTRLAFVDPMVEVTRRLAQVETRFESLSDDWKSRLKRVQTVAQHFNGGSSQLGENRKAFALLIDQFASRQQKAFSDTNDTMQRCAGQLNQQHDHMISRGIKVLGMDGLSPEEAAALRDEIDESTQRHRRLQDALRHHADWQRAHDSLQGVDEAMEDGTKGDGTEAEAAGEAMSVLLAPAIDDLPVIEQLVRDAPVHWRDGVVPETIADLCKQVNRNCDRLRITETAEAYRALRKSFDDMFFEVDLQTLRIVNHSREAAVAFERRLRHAPPDPS